MEKETVFQGSAVALITPFNDRGVDYDAFGALIDWHLEKKTDAFVICGTTGEASTLTDEEHIDVIKYACERVQGKKKIIAGTGSNDTDYSLWLSKEAEAVGADALLLVTPYYNKATPKGLIKHFSTVADNVKIPSILYNVPSRTGCNIPLSVYKELAKHENIVATKEASGNLSAIAEIASECGDSLDIYSGNDDQIVPIMSLGGKGVISVLANVLPDETHDMCEFYLNGNTKGALELQLKYLDLINKLFCEVNPIPVKTAMHLMGRCGIDMRAPLCEMEDANRASLEAVLKKHAII